MGEVTTRLGRTRSEEGDRWVFRFHNGLVIHTEPFMKADRARILPLGGPQDTILSYLARAPETVQDRRVFEPFAGSGVLGLMALRLGAAHVELLDVNPRAAEFQRDNARRNGFAASRFDAHVGSIEDFEPAEPFDVVLANPPFVPTPPGVEGSIASAAGPEGHALVEPLLRRLHRLLAPAGEALIYAMQLLVEERPLVAALLERSLPGRTTALTPVQAEPLAFDAFVDAYRHSFPDHHAAIERWRAGLQERHGDPLSLQHYVMHVGPASADADAAVGSWSIHDDLHEKYGMLQYPAGANPQLALARVMENVVPEAG